MIKCFFQQTAAFVLAALLFACSSTNNKPLLIDFSADSSAIVFNNIDPGGLLQLKSLNKRDSILYQLISVLETASEKDPAIREQEIAGNIMATDSNLVFIPVQPFVKDRDYLIVTHLNVEFGQLKDLLNGDLVNRIRPIQKVLTR